MTQNTRIETMFSYLYRLLEAATDDDRNAAGAASAVESVMDRAVYDVFLGGSCGDTAWRRQLVIPHLRQLGLSYFDPQRVEWSEEMINEEAVAKEVCYFKRIVSLMYYIIFFTEFIIVLICTRTDDNKRDIAIGNCLFCW